MEKKAFETILDSTAKSKKHIPKVLSVVDFIFREDIQLCREY